ncbi:MAG: DUF2336 domain-containing protein [Pseudolabrys sp.]|nr:DUF2336 domain-containing protein [Pseudolabrys sp.]
MGAPASLLPELEDVIQHGSPEKRAETLRRITTLFIEGSDYFAPEHVALFDDVIGILIEEIETKALAELSQRIAPVSNAPTEVVSALATNDDIAVAGPVLRRARLSESDLRVVAQTKSQAHLLALSSRVGITESLSDIIVARGDRDVSRSIANNAQARLSEKSFTTLVERAGKDNMLAEKVGLRSDIPPRLFRQLLMQATEVVQQRLLAQAKPETQAEIRRVLSKISLDIGTKVAKRDYTAALATVRALNAQRALNETDVTEFAKAGKYEETIAALATVCAVPIEVVDRLMGGERSDPVLILARSAGFKWETVSAVINTRPGAKGTSTQALEAAKENFERLSNMTAQRVVRFWQVRQGA